MVATCSKQSDAVDLLLQHGASPAIPDENGQTCLMVAAHNGSVDQIRLILDATKTKPNFINEKNHNGQTALMVATCSNQNDAVDLLLQLGASSEIPDENSRTCLMVAAQSGYIELVQRFTQLPNVTIDEIDENGDTALLLAVEKGHIEVVKELCKNKANVNFHVGDKCVLRKALEKGCEMEPNKAYKDIATSLICDFG